jgi:hypothetical protein
MLFARALPFALVAVTASVAEARPVSEKVTERIVGTAVDEGLEALDTDTNKRHLANVIGSSAMRTAVRGTVASAVQGVVDGLVESGKSHGIEGFDGAHARTAIEKNLAPAAGTLTRRVVDAALVSALSDENAKRAEHFAELATRGVVRGLAQGIEYDLGPALGRTIKREIGPAVAHMLRENILPGVAQGLSSSPMQVAVSQTTASIAGSLVRSADHAIDETQQQKPEDERGIKLVGNKIALGYAVALFFAVAFAAMLIVLTVFLVRSGRRQRQIEHEGRTRERLLLDLLDSLGRDHPTIKSDLHRLVNDELREKEPQDPAPGQQSKGGPA